MQTCSNGWSLRCPRSRGKKCRCSCGGKNHGGKNAATVGMDEVNYDILKVTEDFEVTIRDVGPWHLFKTVTNAAEKVVEELLIREPRTKRIFYYDSEGQLDELVIKGGRFAGFAPGQRAQKETP